MNNDNNTQTVLVYGSVMMTKPFWPVSSEQRQAAANPHTKPTDMGCELACRLLSPTFTIAICRYYYSAERWPHFTVPRRVEGRVNLSKQGVRNLAKVSTQHRTILSSSLRNTSLMLYQLCHQRQKTYIFKNNNKIIVNTNTTGRFWLIFLHYDWCSSLADWTHLLWALVAMVM